MCFAFVGKFIFISACILISACTEMRVLVSHVTYLSGNSVENIEDVLCPRLHLDWDTGTQSIWAYRSYASCDPLFSCAWDTGWDTAREWDPRCGR